MTGSLWCEGQSTNIIPERESFEAFYTGIGYINNKNFDFIVKLDGDLLFDEHYFKNMLSEFASDPRLGIGGGQLYYVKAGKAIDEDCPDDHVRGPTKIYRRTCFDQIGGIVRQLGWDTLDEVMARMYGWKTRSFPAYGVRHLRRTGSRGSILKGKSRHGRAAFTVGYNPLYFLLRCLYR